MTTVSIWLDLQNTCVPIYFSSDIISSLKLTVHFSEQIMPTDKYWGIFSRQMENIVFIYRIRSYNNLEQYQDYACGKGLLVKTIHCTVIAVTCNLIFFSLIQVCREFQRGLCSREECRYAHPPRHVSVDSSDGMITVCMDFMKARCQRESCRYFHPPAHLQGRVRAAQQQTMPVSFCIHIVLGCMFSNNNCLQLNRSSLLLVNLLYM